MFSAKSVVGGLMFLSSVRKILLYEFVVDTCDGNIFLLSYKEFVRMFFENLKILESVFFVGLSSASSG